MEKKPENQESDSTCSHSYGKIAAQIKKAVNEMQAEDITEDPENAAAKAAGGEGDNAPEKGDGEGEVVSDFTVGDAEIERAVKAGLSVADARAFRDKDAFERVCSILESKGGDKKTSTGSGKDGDGEDDHAFDFDVPEMTEDEEYDPKVVKLGAVVRQMGSALKKLGEENRSLREQIGKSVQAGSEAEREAERAKKVEQRKQLSIAPPGGQRGQRKEKSEDDIMAEVASEISSKFGI
jgi:hypothetical protein